jgi:hypothetical protein
MPSGSTHPEEDEKHEAQGRKSDTRAKCPAERCQQPNRQSNKAYIRLKPEPEVKRNPYGKKHNADIESGHIREPDTRVRQPLLRPSGLHLRLGKIAVIGIHSVK